MFSPQVGLELHIAHRVYRIAAHPSATWMPYGQEGRAAIVYQVIDESGEKYALKVFKPRYRHPSLALLARQLAPFANLKGLKVCRRQVLTPQKHRMLLKEHQDLLYALLMPWIEGPTWMEVLQTEGPLEAATSLQLARELSAILSGMEAQGVAHCDLSGPNVLLPLFAGGRGVELVDVEGLYGPGLPAPEEVMGGSMGYAHVDTRQGVWHAAADRFAGAVLIAEMLGWSDARICQAAYGESYFAPDEMQQATERYRRLQQVLRERWGDEIGELFRRAWFSPSLWDAPKFAAWQQALDTVAAQGSEARPVGAYRASPLPAVESVSEEEPVVETVVEEEPPEAAEWALWDLPPEETFGEEAAAETERWAPRVIAEAEPAFEETVERTSQAAPRPPHPFRPASPGGGAPLHPSPPAPAPFAEEEFREEGTTAVPVKIIVPVALLSLLLLACAGLLLASQSGLFTSERSVPTAHSESSASTSSSALVSTPTASPMPLPTATEGSLSSGSASAATTSDDTLWLAYVSGSPGQANLYAVPVDLSEGYPVAEMERRVALATKPGFDEAEPSWSPDGRYLVFQANYDGNYDLWIVKREGGEPVNLTRTPDRGEFEPAWWQEDKIYYRQGSPDGRIEEGTIYLLEGVTLQGGYEDQVPTPMRGRSPEVSPEGDVTYMATVGGVWQVFLYDSRFGTTSQLTTYQGGSCRWPMWSPRGDAIVYNLANSNLAPIGIAKMTIEGSREPEVLLSGESAGRPSWSPSGWIAFNSDKGIEVMDENGQRRHLLIPGDAWAPVWSH